MSVPKNARERAADVIASLIGSPIPVYKARHPHAVGMMMIAGKNGLIIRRCYPNELLDPVGSLKTTNDEQEA